MATRKSPLRSANRRQAAPTERLDNLEIFSWWDSETREFGELVFRLLASMPGGDEAADVGYEPFPHLGWKEWDMIAKMMEAVDSDRDVAYVVQKLMGPSEEKDSAFYASAQQKETPMTQNTVLTNRARAHAAMNQRMAAQRDHAQKRLAQRLAALRKERAERRAQSVEVDGQDITPHVQGPVTMQVERRPTVAGVVRQTWRKRQARPLPERRPAPQRLRPDATERTATDELHRRITVLRRQAVLAKQKAAAHQEKPEPVGSPRFAALRAKLAARRQQTERTAEVPSVIRTRDGHTWQLID